MSKQEPRMTKKELLDSLPVGPRATDGKDPMRDLSVGPRPRYKTLKPVDENERLLLETFHTWMKRPTQESRLVILADLMLAHEIRAFIAKAEAKVHHAAQAAQQ